MQIDYSKKMGLFYIENYNIENPSSYSTSMNILNDDNFLASKF